MLIKDNVGAFYLHSIIQCPARNERLNKESSLIKQKMLNNTDVTLCSKKGRLIYRKLL